ncbi:hypothetical protein [Maricaulis sp.]|uniref:hypothetical protein n=1 Tax=Maricaulis sp. TaxID=1486257 RepID=UPI003A939C92
MMKSILGVSAAIAMSAGVSGVPALAMQDEVTTPAGRAYTTLDGAEIRFSADGELRPDGNGGQFASGNGYYSRDMGFCTAHVEMSWEIQVDSDGHATTRLETSKNTCAEMDPFLEDVSFDASDCTHGWDSLGFGGRAPVCWASIELTRG